MALLGDVATIVQFAMLVKDLVDQVDLNVRATRSAWRVPPSCCALAPPRPPARARCRLRVAAGAAQAA
jgi:hypothetical protein